MKTALVMGGGGFIGSHLVKRLKNDGFWVRSVDLKKPDFSESTADDFIIGDLRDPKLVSDILFSPNQNRESDKKNSFDEVYQLAADMGGAGYIFSGDNDANVMHNSGLININVAYEATKKSVKRLFYSSSACIYPSHNQIDSDNPKCSEDSAYPANPDSEYGWEKLFSERLYLSFYRNYGLQVRIARYHNIFGPEGTFDGGKEKAPAAICRKIICSKDNDTIEIWGSGTQTRSFLYIDECIEGTLKLMRSDFIGPVNIGSEEMISINNFTKIIINISGKNLTIKNINGPMGVNGRNSDNKLIYKKLGWKPEKPLINGIKTTYNWIKSSIDKNSNIN
jgi:GDP-D-mannose 3',5'-epimerase